MKCVFRNYDCNERIKNIDGEGMYLKILKRKTVKDRICFPIISIGIFLMSMFINPDPYLGIADHYIFMVVYILSYFPCKRSIMINIDTQICFFMLCWLMMYFLVSLTSGGISSGYILSYLLYVLMLLLINGTRHSKTEIKFFLNSYIFSAIIICILIIVFRYDFYGGGVERITIKVLNNPAIDPNYLGAYIVVPFIICYGKLLTKFKWTICIVEFLLVAGMLSTASRGAMLAAVVGVLITTYMYFKENRKIRKILIIASIIMICGVIVLNYVPKNSLIRLFDFNAYEDASNNKRIADWLVGLEAFYQRPLLGYGLRGEMSIIQEITGFSRIAHNTYIAALLQFGVLGVLLFGLYIGYLFRKNKNNCTIIGCLVATLIVCVFISAETSVFLWIPIMMASLIGNYEKEDAPLIM